MCMVCGSSASDEKDDLMLLCDGDDSGVPCQLGCHLRCSGLAAVPQGGWFCTSCAAPSWLSGDADDDSLIRWMRGPRPIVPLVCSGEWLARHASVAPAVQPTQSSASMPPLEADSDSALEVDEVKEGKEREEKGPDGMLDVDPPIKLEPPVKEGDDDEAMTNDEEEKYNDPPASMPPLEPPSDSQQHYHADHTAVTNDCTASMSAQTAHLCLLYQPVSLWCGAFG